MKLFSILFTDGLPELAAVAEGIAHAGHDIIYFVATDFSPEMRARFPRSIFHNHFDALAGKPALGIEDMRFEPPGAPLLTELAETESLVLTMMNKLLGSLSVMERKHLYYRMVGYWNTMLSRYKPDAILFPVVPHEVYDLVIYALAKRAGIRTVMFTATQDFVRLLLMHTYEEGVRALTDEFARSAGISPSLEMLSPDIRAYVLKHTASGGDPTPPSMRNLERVYKTPRRRVVVQALRDGTILSKSFSYIRKWFGENLPKEYRAYTTEPDFERPYVYVPLQYQPEATTSPLAGHFVDQRLLVEILSAALPAEWLLYVKEHPRQFVFAGLNYSQYRYRGYYRGLAGLSNVRLVPVETDTFTLMTRAKAVGLNTGTAGLEAVLRGKPVLLFGSAWYRDCPGVSRVSDVTSCKAMLSQIQRASTVSREDVLRYFWCVDRVSFCGYIEPHLKARSDISETANVANLTKTVLSAL